MNNPAAVQKSSDSATSASATKNILNFIFLQGLVILGLLAALIYEIDKGRPSDSFFAETMGGQRQQLINLGTPSVNNDAMLSWAAQAATDAMTFGFNDIDQRLATVRGYFTEEGWNSFLQAMAGSRLFADVDRFQQIVTSIPAEPPALLSWGLQDGVYVSIVYVPILMTIRAGSKRIPTRADAILTIVSMPTSENPRGIGIHNWSSPR